jgi:hypothetical protein
VVLAFVRMRRAIATNRNILAKLAEVERRLEAHDADIQDLMEAIRELINPPDPPRRRIGFAAPAGSPGHRGRALKDRTLHFPHSK